jgi:hypothetical protein
VTNTVAKTGDLQALLNDPGLPTVTYVGVLAIADGDDVVVPPGKTLIATDGVTLTSTSVFIVAGTLNLGESTIDVTTGGVVVGSDPTALQKKVTGATVSAVQNGSETITVASTGVTAVVGNITINGESTTATSIKNTDLGTGTLYVFGNVTASAALGAAKVNVAGDVKVDTADQTAAVVWRIQGNLDAQKAPTTGNATLTVGGNATFTEGLTTGTGLFKIGGNLTVASGKATSLGGNLTVGGTASFGGALTSAATSAATFNGATTVTGAVTTTAALTIAGKGAVTLAEVPVLTNGLTVTNTAGVTFSSAFDLTASKSITATAGKVIFGTGAHSVTITKGTLKSAAVGLASVAANGVVTLPFSTDGASLVLANGGSVAIAGTGKVAIGATAELKGPGSAWTAGTDTVTFAATAAATASITGGTSATLTPSGANAELYLLAANASQALTIGGDTKFTLDLSDTGKITFDKTTADSTITLTANTDGIKLSSSLAIVGTSTAGANFTGAFVVGTGSYDETTLNVSLVNGVIQHSSTNDAAPAAIDKTTIADSLASAAS